MFCARTERRDGVVSWTKRSRYRRVRSSTELFQEPLCGRGGLRARSVAIEVVRDRGGRDSAFGAGNEKAFFRALKKQKPRHLSGACVLVRHGWTIISRISPRVSPPVTKNVVTETASRNARAAMKKRTKRLKQKKKKAKTYRRRVASPRHSVTSPRARFPGPRASPCSGSSPGRPTTCPGTSRR